MKKSALKLDRSAALKALITFALLWQPLQGWSTNRYVIGMGAGWQNYSEFRDFKNDDLLGLHFGYRLNQRWGIESLYAISETSETPTKDIKAQRIHLAGHYHLKPYKLIQPYLGAGIGEVIFDLPEGKSHETLVNFSAGLYLAPTGWAWPIRIAYNSYYSADSEVFDNSLMISFSHFFGPKLALKTGLGTETTPEAETQALHTPTLPSQPQKPAVKSNVAATEFTFKINKSCNLHNCSEKNNSNTLPSLNIQFPLNSSEISASSKAAIKSLANYLKNNNHQQLIFEGHSDAQGSKAYNNALSLKRAKNLKKTLVTDYAINPHRIKVVGFGEERPIASNASEAGRAKNRRVEIQVPAAIAGTREPF